jgi:hypothetical protein
MQKLIFPTVALFLAVIFSCNKSNISTPGSFELKLEHKNLNIVLFDQVHIDSVKPEHVKFFSMTYATDSSKSIIESNLAFGVTELQKGEIFPAGSDQFSRDPEVPWSYCINDGTVMTGLFLDYYVTDDLLKNKTALAKFKTWFEKVVVDWMNANSLSPKVKINKPGQYWKKIIGSVA